MSILGRVDNLEMKVEDHEGRLGRQDERISGSGGLVNAMGALAEEVRSMKRAMWTVAGGILIAAIGFGFSVLQLVHP